MQTSCQSPTTVVHIISWITRLRMTEEIRLTFGSGGFVCSFNENEQADFHQFIERRQLQQSEQSEERFAVC